jgi:hypothetical protein
MEQRVTPWYQKAGQSLTSHWTLIYDRTFPPNQASGRILLVALCSRKLNLHISQSNILVQERLGYLNMLVASVCSFQWCHISWHRISRMSVTLIKRSDGIIRYLGAIMLPCKRDKTALRLSSCWIQAQTTHYKWDTALPSEDTPVPMPTSSLWRLWERTAASYSADTLCKAFVILENIILQNKLTSWFTETTSTFTLASVATYPTRHVEIIWESRLLLCG